MNPTAIIKAEVRNRPGPTNAIKGRDLARLAGITTRDLQHIARELRADGFPIVSTCHAPFGYYLATAAVHLDAYRNQLTARRNDLSTAIKELDRLYIGKQGSLL